MSGDAEAGSKVHVKFPDGTVLVVTAGTDGKYSADSTIRQPDGKVNVYATDINGHDSAETIQDFSAKGPDTSGVVLSVDLVAGDDIINQAESEAPTTMVSGTVTGAHEDAKSIVVSFTLDGSVYTAEVGPDNTWSVAVNTDDLLANGDKIIHATATLTNADGYTSSVVDNHPYKVDVDVKLITITAVTGDGLINESESASVSISGITSVEAGQSVTVTVTDSAGTQVNGTALVGADGKWRVEGLNLEGLVDGDLTVIASAVDQAGNPTETTRDAVLDTQAPDVTNTLLTVNPVAGDDVINAAESELINTTISGSLSNLPPGVTEQSVVVTINGKSHDAVLLPDGSWSVSVLTQDLLEAAEAGQPTIVAQATLKDKAGNSSGLETPHSYSVQLTSSDSIDMQLGSDFVDTLPPSSVEPDADQRLILSTDKYTSDNIFTLAPVFTEGVQAVTYQYSYQGGPWITMGTGATIPGDFSVNLASGSMAKGDGIYNFRISGTDKAGNAVGSDSVAITLDTTAPTGTKINAAGGKRVTGTAEAGSWIAIDFSFNGTGVDAYTRTSETAAADGKFYWTYESAVAIATKGSVTAVAYDKAGNASTTSDAVGVDNSAPTLTLDATDGVTVTGTVADLDTPYPSASVTAPITITLTVDTRPGQPDNVSTVYTTKVTADGKWSYTLPNAIPMGAQVTAVATDAAGNVSAPQDVTVGGGRYHLNWS